MPSLPQFLTVRPVVLWVFSFHLPELEDRDRNKKDPPEPSVMTCYTIWTLIHFWRWMDLTKVLRQLAKMLTKHF